MSASRPFATGNSEQKQAPRDRASTSNDEESNLLASLGSSVQNMDQYEEQVLQSAELDNAPKLAGIGFPSLLSLAPSGHALSDIKHFQSVLARIRTDVLQKKPHNLKGLLKQQMLLNVLHTATNDSDLSVRPQEEFKQETQRKRRFRQKHQQLQKMETSKRVKRSSSQSEDASSKEVLPSVLKTSNKRRAQKEEDEEDLSKGNRLEQIKQGKAVHFASDSELATSAKRRVRMGMQQRRKEEKRDKPSRQRKGQSQDLDEKQWQKRKDTLLALRKEREVRRKRRRRQLTSASNVKAESSDDENEFVGADESAPIVSANSVSQLNGESSQPNVSGSVASEIQGLDTDRAPDSIKDETKAVECPICQSAIEVPSGGNVDHVLSQHMGLCQSSRTRGQRRSSRVRATSTSYVEIDENDGENTDQVPSTAPSAGLAGLNGDEEHYENFGDTEGDDDEDLVVDQVKEDPVVDLKSERTKSVHRPAPPVQTSAIDDWDEDNYEDRVDDWVETGIQNMRVMKERDQNETPPGEHVYEGGLLVSAWVNDRLFPYQRTAIQWMWELHKQQAGGIIGDEMGLGKTVQVCSFLGCMAASRKLKCVLIVSPATMLQHWLKELQTWAPGLRRILIHQSGADDGRPRSISLPLLKQLDQWLKLSRRERLFEAIDDDDYEMRDSSSFCGTGYVVVTTYENVRRSPDVWTMHHWSYVVMDEAQKVRNPDADITLVCKRLRTPHRLALSGTPIQNDLRELWSLFDFVFPGRLGTLPAFETEFADPIKRGGYSNASPMQVQLAYRCALVLRDLINPYLLRRLKKDIKEVNRMPGKKEQVLFCRLTDRQRVLYESFLESDQVKSVLRGSAQLLGAITTLRKICNHPDLVCPPDNSSLEKFIQKGYLLDSDLQESYSDDDNSVVDEDSVLERSGKLEVLAKILPLWYKQGHRVLIFCQWKKMLNIIERFVTLQGWKFGRLDGNTNVASRQRLVDTFNTDESYFGMLCTTRTGGVGLNLTGADRIILYDPDWNPQTDAQARERAWRFGQEREVTIYRLISAGTVEEKIYQRQIFKTALSNRVLQDPRQQRLFSQKDLKDLFTLKADSGSVITGGDGMTETSELTKGKGYVDPDEEERSGDSKDDGETMRSVLLSKGLTAVFDHGVVESNDVAKKSTVRDMEAKARKIAKEAAAALKESVSGADGFTPTWTGSEETHGGRFGYSRPESLREGSGASSVVGVGSGRATSSASLLASIRERNEDVKAVGKLKQTPSKSTKEYSDLLKKIRAFVRRNKPSTDELLDEFSSIKQYDAAVFRRLLKSVAVVEDGRWELRRS